MTQDDDSCLSTQHCIWCPGAVHPDWFFNMSRLHLGPAIGVCQFSASLYHSLWPKRWLPMLSESLPLRFTSENLVQIVTQMFLNLEWKRLQSPVEHLRKWWKSISPPFCNPNVIRVLSSQNTSPTRISGLLLACVIQNDEHQFEPEFLALHCRPLFQEAVQTYISRQGMLRCESESEDLRLDSSQSWTQQCSVDRTSRVGTSSSSPWRNFRNEWESGCQRGWEKYIEIGKPLILWEFSNETLRSWAWLLARNS